MAYFFCVAVALIFLRLLFMILYIFLPTYHRSPKISFNDYLLMIALTIFVGIFWPELSAGNEDKKLIAFAIIFVITIFCFVLACSQLGHKKYKKTVPCFTVLIKNSLFIFSISVILLLIYIQISNSLSGSVGHCSGSSGSDLAICVAIISASAIIYNAQRVSKQELTKNRQDWITTVRLETAKIISTFDFFKATYNKDLQSNDDERAKVVSNCKSLVRSCTKLRMFLNPGDTIAPMITVQLDAIVNYCNSWLNKTDSNEIPTIQSINDVNLHTSLMPWVLVLLKAEWERVKDVLESREVMSDGFYSESVYKDEWDKERLKKYGIKVKNSSKDDIIKALFRGFKFCEKDNKEYYDIISQKLEQLGLVDEQDSGTSGVDQKIKKALGLK